ncbi:ATP phosphoribosyltransferase [Myroides sp. LJL115]
MSKLTLAIQKGGRLSEKSLELLKECGIKIPYGAGKLIAQSTNFPLEVLFLRDDDIPRYVQNNIADIGIVGENVFLEEDLDLDIVRKLGFSACRLSLAVTKDADYTGLDYFQGKKIATSYPVLLQKFLDENKIQATIETISGSVEIAPSIGLAQGVCDIVSSGSTLMSNGLKEVESILFSQAILIKSKELSQEKTNVLSQLVERINALLLSKENKYILLNAPNESIEQIITILPGVKSPSIFPLATKGWSSVHSVINEDDFWSNIQRLKQAGAQGILVLPIEKMIL